VFKKYHTAKDDVALVEHQNFSVDSSKKEGLECKSAYETVSMIAVYHDRGQVTDVWPIVLSL